jgi:hypothetical protein
MNMTNFLRRATLALLLVAATGAMSAVAVAEPSDAAPQPGQQNANAAPYDSPDFTVPFNDVY